MTMILEAAAARGLEADEAVGVFDVPERLRPFIVPREESEEVLDASQAAVRLHVCRTTVYNWVKVNALIAWKPAKRGLRIPAAQILGPGRVIKGLADVVESIGDPELAWAFLTREWPFEHEVAKPLELLKAGRVAEVLDAAPGFGATFT